MEHLIGKPIRLTKKASRVFGEAEEGIIRTLFTMPLADPNGTLYADIDWFDGSFSAFPVTQIEVIPMNAIWKFPVKIGRQTISGVPRVHRFIHADYVTDGAKIDFAVWAEVDVNSVTTKVDIVVRPTGPALNLSSNWQYINSFRTNHNSVPEFWHVYKAVPKRNPEDCNVATTKEST